MKTASLFRLMITQITYILIIMQFTQRLTDFVMRITFSKVISYNVG